MTSYGNCFPNKHPFFPCAECGGCYVYFAKEICNPKWTGVWDPCDGEPPNGLADWYVVIVNPNEPAAGCEGCYEAYGCEGQCSGGRYCWPNEFDFQGIWKDEENICWSLEAGCGSSEDGTGSCGPGCSSWCGEDSEDSSCPRCAEGLGQCRGVMTWCEFSSLFEHRDDAILECVDYDQGFGNVCSPECCCDDDGGGGGGYCCDPGPGNACPPGQECCAADPPQHTNCYCSENCDGTGTPGCPLDSPCCIPDDAEGAHSMQIIVEVQSNFNYGGHCVCGGGGATGLAEDSGVERFGTPTFSHITGQAGEGGQVDLACGNIGPNEDIYIHCCDNSECPLPMSNSEQGFGPQGDLGIECLSNCDQIDESCCSSGRKLTDYFDCGGGNPGYYPQSADCPQDCSHYGMSHLSFGISEDGFGSAGIVKNVPCNASTDGNGYKIIGVRSSLNVPVIKLGHYCKSDGVGTSYGCAGGTAQCCAEGGTLGSFPSFSAGTDGYEVVDGVWDGEVKFLDGGIIDGNPCYGRIQWNLQFTPDQGFPISWSFNRVGMCHPCGGGQLGGHCPNCIDPIVVQWFNFDLAILNQGLYPWVNNMSDAEKVRLNCGHPAPGYFQPTEDNPIIQFLKGRITSPTGPAPQMHMLETQETANILMGKWGSLPFVNQQHACDAGDANTYGADTYWKTNGWHGCMMDDVDHACDQCGGKVVDLDKRYPNFLGGLRFRISMSYD